MVGRAKVTTTTTTTTTEYNESEYRRLKKTTSLLELALWKINLDNSRNNRDIMCGGNKKFWRLIYQSSDSSVMSVVEPIMWLKMCGRIFYLLILFVSSSDAGRQQQWQWQGQLWQWEWWEWWQCLGCDNYYANDDNSNNDDYDKDGDNNDDGEE